MAKIKILLVEDDENLATSISNFLKDFADVEHASDGLIGQTMGSEGIYDLAILDIMLPQKNGWDVLKSWREDKTLNLPVLILTAKDTIADKLDGFNLGGDDYLIKPFHREELLARIRALLKRAGKDSDDGLLQIGELTANTHSHEITFAGEKVDLPGKEYDILVYFLQNPNVIVTKNQIFDRLWGFESDTSISVVEVYMSNLRKNLKSVGAADLIRTIRNVGYILEVGD